MFLFCLCCNVFPLWSEISTHISSLLTTVYDSWTARNSAKLWSLRGWYGIIEVHWRKKRLALTLTPPPFPFAFSRVNPRGLSMSTWIQGKLVMPSTSVLGALSFYFICLTHRQELYASSISQELWSLGSKFGLGKLEKLIMDKSLLPIGADQMYAFFENVTPFSAVYKCNLKAVLIPSNLLMTVLFPFSPDLIQQGLLGSMFPYCHRFYWVKIMRRVPIEHNAANLNLFVTSSCSDLKGCSGDWLVGWLKTLSWNRLSQEWFTVLQIKAIWNQGRLSKGELPSAFRSCCPMLCAA